MNFHIDHTKYTEAARRVLYENLVRAVTLSIVLQESMVTTKHRRSFMKRYIVKGNLFAVALMALLLALSVPATSLAQDEHGRGHGRNRDNSDWSRRNRKCGKFVNCHDASEGRWDRRGARGDRVGNIFLRNRIRNRNLGSSIMIWHYAI
jgi:hypothetical protein